MNFKRVLSITCVIMFIGLLVGGGTWFKAEHLDEGSYLTTETRIPLAAFRLQTTGEDLRVYIIKVKEMQGWTCMFIAGTNKGDTFCTIDPVKQTTE